MVATRDSTGTESTVRSFRDPAGTVLRYRGRILRTVHWENAAELEAFLATRAAREAMDSGQLVRSLRIPPEEAPGIDPDAGALYEHERVPFPSYPHEWPPEMLAAAGALTLELFEGALREEFGLKDATPYNVLFRGPRPVFVDVLSFERREARDASWMAYAQFVRTFLLPLLACRHFGLAPGGIFAAHRDGLEPEVVYEWAGWSKRFTPPLLSLVTLPKWLSKRATADIYRPQPLGSAEQARFVLDRLLATCRRQLAKAAPRADAESSWSGYLDYKSLYTPAQLAQKEGFVREALELVRPRRVLDVGANEGHFSIVAARHGASVVAIDSDPVVTGRMWREALHRELDILPLVVDLARPTPAVGWRNQECDSFLDRARGHFDMVMMLAVIHHMLVAERVPLEEILALVEDLTSEYALIEFVAPQDPMFARIVRGREALYSNLTIARFEAAAASRFDLVKSLEIDGLHRCLYLFRRRHATT
jgi:SAM-dependent methyltransferase